MEDYFKSTDPTTLPPAPTSIDGPSASPTRKQTPGPVNLPSEDDFEFTPSEDPERIGRYRVKFRLGKGGFGIVYLATDEELDRDVAIKVPHGHLVAHADAYLREAKTVAKLDHVNIVPVYDVGKTDDYPCFIVSKYIEGIDLAERLKISRLEMEEAAELVIAVAEALHYAHKQGFFHRDVKPGNLLLDLSGRPYVTDFGLALREAEIGSGAKYAGTPAYMSPEQARGEGHRVDGRSDIFSLGIVFYEILTGRRPFHADSVPKLLERIIKDEIRPPRQINDLIPKELERICLKSLSKRARDRYTTCRDLADDLRFWLEGAGGSAKKELKTPDIAVEPIPNPAASPPVAARVATPASTPQPFSSDFQSGLSSSDSLAPKIIPKGLRSFEPRDSDFFLELLPGPRDRLGLPESIRFWRSKIESTEEGEVFPVGLVYGPSGCGKSSLIKAGLLPRLDSKVVVIYLDAASGDTERLLLRKLQSKVRSLSQRAGVAENLIYVRRGHGLAQGEKLLIVIDQFEQWLHSHGCDANADLIEALRQCDGVRVQCLLMVRDDFWLALTRFMQEIEVHINEGENALLVDLFDLRHARRVLAALGHAFGAISDSEKVRTKEQNAFLDMAVESLSQDHKVVPVRLSLFAEMVKSKSWTPSTLKESGGAEGVGVDFLEETFSSPNASSHHRLHHKAVQAVLASLLPEPGSDIKGHKRSRQELLSASGLQSRPQQFADVMKMLDGELRLVTPCEIETLEDEGNATPPAGEEQFYQLTHDYLVPSLRTWITRKQRATRQGRAELRLADLAGHWNAKPEARRLPSLFEFLQIRVLSARANWSESQRKMMDAAAHYHAIRTLVWIVAFVVFMSGVYVYQARFKAHQLHDQLLSAKIENVPSIVDALKGYRAWIDPLLRADEADAHNSDADRKLRVALALLPDDDNQIQYLYERLLNASIEERGILRHALLPYKDRLIEKLWGVVRSPVNPSQQLNAACALSLYSPDDSQWKLFAPVVASQLSRAEFYAPKWSDDLCGVHRWLVGPLTAIACNDSLAESERSSATNILTASDAKQPGQLAQVAIAGSEKQFKEVLPLLGKHGPPSPNTLQIFKDEIDRPMGENANDPATERAAQRKAAAFIALIRLNEQMVDWALLKRSPDERVRTYLIHWCGRRGVDSQTIVSLISDVGDPGIQQALLLMLGEFSDTSIPIDQRQSLVMRLITIFKTAPDSGLHAAAQWLLQRWSRDSDIRQAMVVLKKSSIPLQLEGQHWQVNRYGQTFVLIDGRKAFLMGSPRSEVGRDGGVTDKEDTTEPGHQRTIGRLFAMAATPVTNEQFQKFLSEHPEPKYTPPPDVLSDAAINPDLPRTGIKWYEAAEYCNWLSAKDGIPSEQWCYKPNKDKEFAGGMQTKENYLSLSGYRLPTEAEWEFACRAGAVTRFAFGECNELLGYYAWFESNSDLHRHPVALLKPNGLGLFDMHGNVFQMCEAPRRKYPQTDDSAIAAEVKDDARASVRGGSCENSPRHVRSAFRGFFPPNDRQRNYGFRPARTISR